VSHPGTTLPLPSLPGDAAVLIGQYPARGGDRPCLAPTGLSRLIGGAADTRQGSRDRRRPVGVRRRLTRRPVRGRQRHPSSVGQCPFAIAAGRYGRYLPWVSRAWWRGGRGSASPLQRGQPIPGRAHGHHGGAQTPRPVGVRRCLTRPARQGRQTTTGVRRRSVVIIAACRDATRMCRALRRGRARHRLAPTTWATHPRSGIRVRRWGADPPSCRGQALPDPSGPPGPADHHRRATAVGRDHRRMPGCDPHVPRLARAGEARLAPTPRPVGVRRLPDPSGPAGPANDTIADRRCAVAVTAGQRRRYSVRRGCGQRHRPSFRRCW
jgi:hypothetical protein